MNFTANKQISLFDQKVTNKVSPKTDADPFILSDLLLLLFRLIDLLFLARDDRRTIHDMVANTIVVKV